MNIEQHDNVLVIRETPGCIWFIGLFFILIGGAFVYGGLGGFTNSALYAPWMLALAALMGATGVAAGGWMIWRAPVTRVIVDRLNETVLVRRYGIFGRTEAIYDFEDVLRFIVIEEDDDEGSPIWSLGLRLAEGETIRISALPMHDERFKQDFAFQVNEFMFRQIPPARMVIEFDDEFEQ